MAGLCNGNTREGIARDVLVRVQTPCPRGRPTLVTVWGFFGVRHLALIVTCLGLTSCTDARMGKWAAYGGSAHIQCYSGGILIYEGHSTGKVASEANSDGYNFIDKKDGRLKEVSGECVIQYKK